MISSWVSKVNNPPHLADLAAHRDRSAVEGALAVEWFPSMQSRLSNRSSRKLENRAAATALNYFAYKLIKTHRTLRMSPAMAAGVTDRLWGRTTFGSPLGIIRTAEGGKSGVTMTHKAAAYEYWVVECRECSALIPFRRAISTKHGYRSLQSPARFQAKCPMCQKTNGYKTADIRIEKKIAFPLIPVGQLPKFSQ